MARKCGTCQHIKRAEIDRRIAAGEPGGQIARDYDLNPSSLHGHRTYCLKLESQTLGQLIGTCSSSQLVRQTKLSEVFHHTAEDRGGKDHCFFVFCRREIRIAVHPLCKSLLSFFDPASSRKR